MVAPRSVCDAIQLVGRPPAGAGKVVKPPCAADEGALQGEPAVALSLQRLREAEERRLEVAARRRRRHRREYDIGWRVERIPHSAALARRLGCELPAEHGLCCLVLDEASRSVRAAACADPAASVNLEYLALALQVRLHAGREPLFSLEPLGRTQDPRRAMQAKRFEPEWLMGTSVGEAMFQADYHLKELSFGEYEQPVVGMRSAFDFAEADGLGREWSARAWFVVRKAEVLMTDDGALIPRVEMGVEARELEEGENGVIDVPMTRPSHPMVKYAAAFTHNFDLIAERRSVVYHLREVAKASVLAKFLLEAQAQVEGAWLDAVDWPSVKEAAAACCLEIPQLWKDYCHAEVRLMDGAVVSGGGKGAKFVSLYGGVEFGLSRFNVLPAQRLPSQLGLLRLPTELVPAVPPEVPSRLAPGEVSLDLVDATGEMLRRQAKVTVPEPRGVDLSLDSFNLSEPTLVKAQGAPAAPPGGAAFWGYLDGEAPDERKALLREVFDPWLSDRRSEGEIFVAPDPSSAHMERLRCRVQEESAVREQRAQCFLSEAFRVGDPGPLFPTSWACLPELAQALDVPKHVCAREEAELDALKAEQAVFDRRTEDGLRFRVYRLGGLEARTVDWPEGGEERGAVFSVADEGAAAGRPAIAKVTLANVGSAAAAAAPEELMPGRRRQPQQEAAERQGRLVQLFHASGELRADREVALAAVQQDGLALGHAAAGLRADRGVVEAAVREHGGSLEFAHEELRGDKDVVLTAIRQDVAALGHASEELRADPAVVSAAMQISGSALSAVAPSLRQDREAVLAAVQKDAFALELASEELLADREFLLAAVRKNAEVLRQLPAWALADRDFVLQVVRDNGFALRYASEALRADPEVVAEAQRQDARVAALAAGGACARGQVEAAPEAAPVPWQPGSPAPAATEEATVWVVVGGNALGGVVVREGADPRSSALQRLAQGARVREVRRVGDRLLFQRLSGGGAESGWVSIEAGGRELLRRA